MYRIDPSLTTAICQFPTPTNITDLRSFFGMVNQLEAFTDRISEASSPLRPLLSSKVQFTWIATHQQAFEAAKRELSSPPKLAFYNPAHPAALYTDASRLKGLGFILRQKQPDDTWRVERAGSRFLSDADTRYPTIELEMLAVGWAV